MVPRVHVTVVVPMRVVVRVLRKRPCFVLAVLVRVNVALVPRQSPCS